VALNAILMANLPGVAIPLVAALWAVLGPTVDILLVGAVRLAAAAVLLASYGKRSTGPPI
jgi:hypothetical protein